MIIDIRTLFIFSVLLFGGFSFTAYYLWRSHKGAFGGLGYWSLAFASHSLAGLLFSFGNAFPDPILIVVANSLIIIGYTFFFDGITLFSRQDAKRRLNYSIAALVPMLFIYFTYVEAHLALRIAIIHAALAYIQLYSAYKLYLKRDDEFGTLYSFNALTFTVLGVVSISRILVALFVDQGSELMTSGLYKGLSILMYVSGGAFIAVGLILLIIKRLDVIQKISKAELELYAEKLSYSQRYLQSIFENEPECVKLLESDGTLIDMNPSGLAMIEVDDIEQVRGQKVHGIVAPEDRSEFAALTRKVCAGSTETLQFRIVGRKGTERWLETHAVPFFDEKGKKTVLLGVTRDITAQKKNEEKLEQGLREKEFLIKEVNHRVKNNLAVLQSLVSMQTRLVKDPIAKGQLENVGNRIRTLSLIHEKLYRTDDVTRIDMQEYIDSLARQIYMSMVIDEDAVKLELDIPQVMLHINYVIPCGLIINELLTNALKYAFPLNEKGTVSVSLREEQNKRYRITIKDTGAGLPDDFDIDMTSGLGMKVVQSLVSQIRGDLKINSDSGTEFSIIFEEE